MRTPVLVALVAVTACVASDPLPAFTSDQERDCYLKVQDTLGPGRTLMRAGDSGFVEVYRVNGFLRDIGPSDSFNACMGAASGRMTARGTVTFTAAEAQQWETLNDAERRAAYDFLIQGGSLAEFMARRG